MRKFVGTINLEGFKVEFEFETEDNATVEEIEITGKETAFGYIDWHYTEVKKN